jgi:hypothetical protein
VWYKISLVAALTVLALLALFATPAARAGSSTSHAASTCAGEAFTDVCPGDYYYGAISYLVTNNVVRGYDASPPCDSEAAIPCFRPGALVTRAQTCKIMWGIEHWHCCIDGGPHFRDVDVNHPFYAAIELARYNYVISGYADYTFHPYDNITRGQFSKVLVLSRQWPIDLTGAPHFSDVTEYSPFYPYIETAANHGVISGYAGGNFLPDNNITRGQASKAVFLSVTLATPTPQPTSTPTTNASPTSTATPTAGPLAPRR